AATSKMSRSSWLDVPILPRKEKTALRAVRCDEFPPSKTEGGAPRRRLARRAVPLRRTEEIGDVLIEALDGAKEFLHARGFAGDFARGHVRSDGFAKLRGPANAL